MFHSLLEKMSEVKENTRKNEDEGSSALEQDLVLLKINKNYLLCNK